MQNIFECSEKINWTTDYSSSIVLDKGFSIYGWLRNWFFDERRSPIKTMEWKDKSADSARSMGIMRTAIHK